MKVEMEANKHNSQLPDADSVDALNDSGCSSDLVVDLVIMVTYHSDMKQLVVGCLMFGLVDCLLCSCLLLAEKHAETFFIKTPYFFTILILF